MKVYKVPPEGGAPGGGSAPRRAPGPFWVSPYAMVVKKVKGVANWEGPRITQGLGDLVSRPQGQEAGRLRGSWGAPQVAKSYSKEQRQDNDGGSLGGTSSPYQIPWSPRAG